MQRMHSVTAYFVARCKSAAQLNRLGHESTHQVTPRGPAFCMKSAASKAGASTVPPPAKIGDKRLRTMPPTWNSGIMLKHTSFALRPQEAITHTAPTASVSRVYGTVFFLPLNHPHGLLSAVGYFVSIAPNIDTLWGWRRTVHAQDKDGTASQRWPFRHLASVTTAYTDLLQVQPGYLGVSKPRWS